MIQGDGDNGLPCQGTRRAAVVVGRRGREIAGMGNPKTHGKDALS